MHCERLDKIILRELSISVEETMFRPNVLCVSSFHYDGFSQLITEPNTAALGYALCLLT